MHAKRVELPQIFVLKGKNVYQFPEFYQKMWMVLLIGLPLTPIGFALLLRDRLKRLTKITSLDRFLGVMVLILTVSTAIPIPFFNFESLMPQVVFWQNFSLILYIISCLLQMWWLFIRPINK